MFNSTHFLKGVFTGVMALGLAAGAAHAANVTVNETIDLSTAQNPGPGAGWFGWRDFASSGGSFSPDFSYDLSAGDTLDFTTMFKTGQTLTLTNPSMFWLFSYAASGATDVNGTGTISLLSSTGAVLLTSNVLSDTEGSAHFGQYFYASNFASLPSTITIGGLEYQGTLNSYVDPTITVRTYNDPQVIFSADSYVLNGVPEPSTWAMLLLGFGGLGIAGYRRSRNTTTA
jgi:hypothetical protein